MPSTEKMVLKSKVRQQNHQQRIQGVKLWYNMNTNLSSKHSNVPEIHNLHSREQKSWQICSNVEQGI